WVLFDRTVGGASTARAGWIDGAGAIWAEDQALRWIAALAGFPPEAGGVFVAGGSAGNLNALVTARHAADALRNGNRPARWRFAAADTVHSSVVAASRVMDVDVVSVPHDERGRLTGEALRRTLDEDHEGVFAVVASAGAANAGTVDDLGGVADVC